MQFTIGAKVLMRLNSTDTWDYSMIVTGAEYNEDRAGWDYSLKETNGLTRPKMVKQSNLKKQR